MSPVQQQTGQRDRLKLFNISCRDMPADVRGRERSRSPDATPRAAPRRGVQRAPQEGHRAMFEDAVRRTGGHADAGAHPPNIKMEPGRDSPEVLVMPPPAGNFKQEFGYNSSQGKLRRANHNRRGSEQDPRSVVITNVHFEVRRFQLNTMACACQQIQFGCHSFSV